MIEKLQEHDMELTTETLAKFVSTASSSDTLTPEVISKLKGLLLDYLGVSASAAVSGDSSNKIFAGIKSLGDSINGSNTVVTKGSQYSPQYAALLNGTFCHTFDFDDTHAEAVLHPGSSVISAALAESESQRSSGSDLLLSLAIGYEVACRLAEAINWKAYPRGFHNTGTVGLFGAIATLCTLRKVSQQVVEDAFGLALSKAAGSIQFVENGAWNKRLHPGFAAHDAFICVSLATAGVVGATKSIEGKYGLLKCFAEEADGSRITTGLGDDWRFLDTACKPYPACRMTHGQIEIAGRLRKKYESHGVPEHITITLPKACFPIVGEPVPYKVHPKNIVDAQFSSYFQTAAAYLYGDEQGWKIYDTIKDERVLQLCRQINVQTSEVYRGMESKVLIRFKNGETVEEEILYPLGEKQHPFDWDSGIQRKFFSLAAPVYGKQCAEQIRDLVGSLENVEVPALMELLK